MGTLNGSPQATTGTISQPKRTANMPASTASALAAQNAALANTPEMQKDAQLNDLIQGPDAVAAYRGSRSPETQALISQAMDQRNGLNAQDNSALRANYLANINSQGQSAMRSLRGAQAASGVRGGVAQAQMAQQAGAQQNALQSAEGGLVDKNIAAKQQGLRDASTIVSGQENVERDQAANKLNTIFMGRAERAGLSAAQMQAQAAAASGHSSGGKK